MAVTTTVVSRVNASVLQRTTSTTLSLNKASIVEIGISKDQVANIHQEGHSVIVTLKNGQIIKIDNFFGSLQNKLVFQDANGELFQVDFINTNGVFTPGDYMPISSLDNLLLPAAAARGASVLPIAALAGVAGAGVAETVSAGNAQLGSNNNPGFNDSTSAGSLVGTFIAQPYATINPTTNSTNTRPTITGTASAGAVVTLYDNGTVIGSTTADASGHWSFTPTSTLSVGAHVITATAILNGTIGPVSNSDGFMVEPPAPTVAQTTSSMNTTPTITGTAAAGAVVTIYDNGQLIGSATADGSGNWSFTPTTPLSVGTQAVTATATVNGATSPVSNTDSFVVQQFAPIIAQTSSSTNTTPTITGTAPAGSVVSVYDNGQLIGSTTADVSGNWSFTPISALSVGTQAITATATLNGTTSSVSNTDSFAVQPPAPTIAQTASFTNTTPTITGTAAAGAVVKIYDNGQLIGSTTADAGGNWNFTPATALPVGTQAITATATLNGATGPVSNTDSFAVQPPAPFITQTPNSPSTTPTITGTAAAGAVVSIYDNGQLIGSTTADAGGHWSFTPSSALPVGTQAITATATLNGATGPVSNTDSFTVEPPAPTIIQTVNSTSTTPTITGTAAAGAVVSIYDNGQLIGSTTANASGNWSFTPSSALPVGTQAITATATLNGATGPVSNTDSFAVQPLAPTIVQTASSTSTTPTIIGTAAAGAVVTITDNGTVIGSIIADSSGNWSFTPSSPLSVGTQAITATATVNGVTGPVSNTDSFAVQPSAPSIAQTGDSTSTTPTITGTAAAGAVVSIYDNGQLIGSTTADAGGHWNFTPSSPLSMGNQAVTATAAVNGATSPVSNTDSFVVQPPAPTIAQTASSSLTTPTIMGTATAGAVVSIYDNGQLIGSTTANASGNWSFTPSSPLSVGAQAITATATVNGATGPVSNTDSFTVQPVVITDTPIINQNASSTDTMPTITGTVTAGSVVTLYDNGQLIGSTTADGSGNWSFTPSSPLSVGAQVITATGTLNGTTSPVSNTDSFFVEPLAPVVVQTTSSTNTTPTITGTAAAGAVVSIYDNGQLIGSTTANASGNWSFTPATPLSVGAQAVTATATVNGATSSVSNTDNFSVQPLAPTITQTASSTSTTPIITGTAAAGAVVTLTDNGSVIGSTTADASGNWSFTPSTPLSVGVQAISATATVNGATGPASNTDNFAVQPLAPTIVQTISSANTTPTITGTAAAGAVVSVYDNGLLIGSTTADGSGNWIFTPSSPLSVGAQAITATETINGATSPVSNTDSFLVEPLAPIVTQTANSTSTTPTITGTAAAGAVVSIYDNGQLIGSTTANASGNWSFTPITPLAVGAQAVTATATVNGATSPVSNTDSFSVQPLAPTITQTASSTSTTPIITGTAPVGAVVTLTDNGSVIGSTTADANGNWSFTPSTPLSAGAQAITATATVNGATGPVSNTDNFFVEPSAPIITQTANSTNTTPMITGTAAAGAVVSIYDNGQLIGSTTADVNGNWSFTPSSALSVGAQAITATATVNGATSPVSNTDSFVVQPSAPTVAQTTSSTSTTPMITGTAVAGAVVSIYDNGQLIGSTTANASGNWSFTPTTPLSVGTQAVTATATVNGATSSISNTDSFAVQPSAPTITQTASSTNTTPMITGTAAAGALVILTDNGTVIGSTTADGSGNWSFTPSALSVGHQAVTATATVNGVSSAASTADNFDVQPLAPTIDQTASTSNATPTITGIATANSVVTLSDNGVVIGSTTADGSGHWNFTPSTPLSVGSQAITATDTVNGVTSPVSNTDSFQIVTPLTDQVWGYQDMVSGIQGNVYTGGQTDDANGTLYGTTTPGATVAIYNGATLIGNATVDASGNWSYQFSNLVNGTYNFTVRATNSIGEILNQTFTLTKYGQVAPVVALNDTELLGVVGAGVVNLLDLSQQPLEAADQNGNITSVTLNTHSTINLFGATWDYDANLATYLGLNAVATSTGSILNYNSKLVVTSIGANIDNQSLLELLGTVHSSSGLLDVSVLGNTTLSATDSLNNTTSQSLGSVANAGVLTSTSSPSYIHESTATNATINDSSDTGEARLYAFGANSTLIAGSGSTIMRTMGGGTNTLTGGSGQDWMDGGSGTNTFNAGSGHTTVYYDLLDNAGHVTNSTANVLGGHSGFDVINNFHLGATTDANADYLDITTLVGSGANAGNINNYVKIDYDAGTHTAVVSIDRAGDGVAANYHQLLTMHLDAATASGTLTVQDLMKNQQLLF